MKHPQDRRERRRLAARSRFKDHIHENETKRFHEAEKHRDLWLKQFEEETETQDGFSR